MPNISIGLFLTIDLIALSICVFIAFRLSRSVLNPAFAFCGLHFYIVTVRLLQIFFGASPMAYFDWPVQVPEVERAAFACDLALFAIAAGWYFGRALARKSGMTRAEPASRQLLTTIATFSLGLGLLGMAIAGRSVDRPLADLKEWNDSGYVVVTMGWPAWAMCLLHYVYGFKPYLCGITVIVLVLELITVPSRCAVLIPLIFLLLLGISRKTRQARIPRFIIPVAALLWAVWLPMKPIAAELSEGSSLSTAIAEGVDHAFTNFGTDEGSGIDFQFLDMIGSTMTLADLHGTPYYGRTILPLLTAPIPRTLWPDKPHINEYLHELEVPMRNMGELGMTAGLVGEAYVNGGWFGIVVTAFLVSSAYTYAFWQTFFLNRRSCQFLLYLVFLATVMQVYRDGLISAVWFPLVYAAPVGWTAMLSSMKKGRGRQLRTVRVLSAPIPRPVCP